MKILEFLSEDNNHLSSTRLIMYIWCIGIFIIWAISTAKNNWQMQEINDSLQIIIGLVLSGKVIQKFNEQKVNNETVSVESQTNK